MGLCKKKCMKQLFEDSGSTCLVPEVFFVCLFLLFVSFCFLHNLFSCLFAYFFVCLYVHTWPIT